MWRRCHAAEPSTAMRKSSPLPHGTVRMVPVSAVCGRSDMSVHIPSYSVFMQFKNRQNPSVMLVVSLGVTPEQVGGWVTEKHTRGPTAML